MNNSFSQLLKKLIKLNGTKLSALAYYIGYDISYISKWASGNSQPSPKHITRINSLLSDFFAEEIVKQHNEGTFLYEFHLQESFD